MKMVAAPDLENGSVNPLRRPPDTLDPQNLALTLPTCGGRTVGILRLRTEATEFSFLVYIIEKCAQN
jgi:hypothetical protein